MGNPVSKSLRVLLTTFLILSGAGRALAQADAPAAPGSAPPPAGAAPAKPGKPDKATLLEAKRAYTAGELSYQAGDYKAAILNFRDAQSRIPSPHAAYWLAMSLKADGQVPEAIAELDAFLASPNAARVGEQKVTEARAALEALRKTPGTLTVTTEPPGAIVAVDGAVLPGVTPLPVEMTPGTHTLTLSLAGHQTMEAQLEMPPGSKGEQRFDLEKIPAPVTTVTEKKAPAEAPPPPAATPPPEARSMVPAYVLFGLAGASAVTGAIFGVIVAGDKARYEDQPTDANADAFYRDGLAANIAVGAAITFGIAGVGYLLAPEADPRKKGALPPSRRFAAAPYASPHSAGAAARFSF